jgi:hypothetical protein
VIISFWVLLFRNHCFQCGCARWWLESLMIRLWVGAVWDWISYVRGIAETLPELLWHLFEILKNVLTKVPENDQIEFSVSEPLFTLLSCLSYESEVWVLRKQSSRRVGFCWRKLSRMGRHSGFRCMWCSHHDRASGDFVTRRSDSHKHFFRRKLPCHTLSAKLGWHHRVGKSVVRWRSVEFLRTASVTI